MEKQEPRSRRKKSIGLLGWAAIGGGTVAAVALIAAMAYFQVSRKYETVFFPNTTINGMDVSKKSVEEVKNMIASGIDGYELLIKERGDITESIKGSDIGLEAVFDGSLEKILGEQDPSEWYKHRKEASSFTLDTMIQYDEDKFDEVVQGLDCMDEEKSQEPESAHISDYVSGQGYSIVAATEGNRLEPEKAKEVISEAILELEPEISLDEKEAYVKPEVSTGDSQLVEQIQTLNKYAGVTITYKIGTEKEVLNGETISKWIGVGQDGTVYLDSSQVSAYVKELASKYDTYTKAKNLKTSYGQTVKITGGVYGWRINQSAEADELAQLIRTGESQQREPIYKQEAASHGATDYGDTYVEINLTAQHLYFYKDGKLVVKSDFVSGNESKGWSTPAGVYSITYKERNATLNGENYSTPVSYWMPFNGNIGLHDASWRSTFGGSIYKTSGSHGCINLPPAVAKTIYENISAGIPVLCYHLAGTESKTASTTAQTGSTAQTTAAAETTKAATTEAPTTTAAVTTAAETTTEAETVKATTEASTREASVETSAATTSAQNENGPGVSSSSGKKKTGPGA